MESGSNIGSSHTLIRKTFKICKLIATLSAGLGPEIPDYVVDSSATNRLLHGSIASITEYAQELQTLKDLRVGQITRLRCLLDVGEDARQDFLQAHLTLSAALIESCAKEIEHLAGLPAQRLPVLIRDHEVLIEQLPSTLHVILLRVERGDDFQATFNRNEDELKYFTELHRKMELFRI
jgi:hypothetical protein